MKLVVTQVNVTVEGEAAEIAEALPAVLGLNQPVNASISAVSQPVATVESAIPVVDPVADAEIVASSPARQVEHPSVADMDEPSADVIDLPARPTGPGSAMPTAPFEVWEDIPKDRLMLSRTKLGVHVAVTPNDPSRVFCGAKLVQRIGVPPIIDDAEGCDSCNRQIGILNRDGATG